MSGNENVQVVLRVTIFFEGKRVSRFAQTF